MLNRTRVRLQGLRTIYSARGVGNTTLMMEGLKNHEGEAVLVSLTRQHAEILAREAMDSNPKLRVIARGLDEPPLRGSRVPVAIDHYALLQMSLDAEMETAEWRTKVNELKSQIEALLR